MKLILVACLAFGFAASPAKAMVASPLVSLDEARARSTAYYLTVDQNDHVMYPCSGTFIAEDLVLTAAHCLPEGTKAVLVFSPEEMKALSSGMPANFEEASFTFAVHPDFKRVDDNYQTTKADIALIRLPNKVPGVTLARLPRQGLELPEGQRLKVMGWGSSAKPRDESTNLREADAKMQSLGEIPLKIEYKFLDPLQGTCSGDSGGPGYLETSVDQIVVGVLSGGPSCNLNNELWWKDPFVATYVPAYVDWIKTTAKNLGSPL